MSTTSSTTKHRHIYLVTKDIFAESKELKGRNLFIKLKVGELIEFRYYHPINFRTVEGIYAQLEEEEFNASTECVGEIWDNVSFRNKASLKNILDVRLFDWLDGWSIDKAAALGCECFPKEPINDSEE